jgi:hypothetical protein
MIWDTKRKNRSFRTRELTFPLHINKHLIQFIQNKIITLLISLSEHRNSKSKILKTRLNETLIEVILPCQPQYSTTSLLIYRTNNIKVAYKNPRGGFPTITTSYNISPSSLFFRRTIISINDWGIEASIGIQHNNTDMNNLIQATYQMVQIHLNHISIPTYPNSIMTLVIIIIQERQILKKKTRDVFFFSLTWASIKLKRATISFWTRRCNFEYFKGSFKPIAF